MKKKGFILIELVAVIIILGVIALVAYLRYQDFAPQAKASVEKMVVVSVRDAIVAYFADPKQGQLKYYPTALDTAEVGSLASSTNKFFNAVLIDPIASDWQKVSAVHYQCLSSGNVYEYDSSNGDFRLVGPTPTTGGTTTTTTPSPTTTACGG